MVYFSVLYFLIIFVIFFNDFFQLFLISRTNLLLKIRLKLIVKNAFFSDFVHCKLDRRSGSILYTLLVGLCDRVTPLVWILRTSVRNTKLSG